MLFREIKESDRAAWLPLWEGYLEFYKHSLSESQTELTWKRLFDDSVRLHGFVVEKDGEVVGFAHCWFSHTTWQDKADLYLEDLFVAPSARRRGAGELLIQGCADFAKSSGSSRLYWQTQRSNESAQKLYNKVSTLSEYIIFEQVFK
jgi:GNAT superfamily N-acetyltransferase